MNYSLDEMYELLDGLAEARFEVKEPRLKNKLADLQDYLEGLIVEGRITGLEYERKY
jgi:transcriptional accessory protein Tex/SPT6